jgi:Acetyltransferases, including N-acetylases of ribosomal proteins
MPKSDRLNGQRLYLRPYKTSDAQALSDMTARDEIYRTTYNIQREFDVEHARWWIKFNANCRRTGTSYEFGIFEKDTGRLVGNIGIVNINSRCRHATLAYYVHPDFWNKGIATEAGGIILDYAFGSLEMNRVGAVCMVDNTASRRVLCKLGFTFEGIARQEIMKDGVFYDVAHYGLLNEEYRLNHLSSKETSL